jgi:beta-glucosidase
VPLHPICPTSLNDQFSDLGLTLRAADFGSNFTWGVASAAYQVEGAHDKNGKGPSIWDTFTGKKGKIFQGQDGKVACDFYHRYNEDLELMRSLNIANFRFSLSWPRIMPDGKGNVSEKGMDFYDRLIDACLDKGIMPWVTLYHWDLPQSIQDEGGWVNRDIAGWLCDYASSCARRLGDRVKYWMILNEPMVFTGAGYYLGIHAPGKKGLRNFVPAAHHAVLCQAMGANVIRDESPRSEVGTTFSYSHITPLKDSFNDRNAATRVDALLNRMFLEPALGLGYPIEDLKILKRLEPYIQPGDMKNVQFDFDFIGLQMYTREVVTHSYMVPYLSARIVKASERVVPTTVMDWEVYPEGIYHALNRLGAYKGIKSIIISENGAAFQDELRNGTVHDPSRLNYLQRHIEEVYRAKCENIPVNGYFVWTFTDNFEWAEGYKPRFGLVYTDFPSQKRIVKASGRWYASFIEG